ncbi:MAG TPA: ribonuclease domain-containing protein [Dyella sp.]|uniref:ribonuclease domain-containing protein n=1 Tax=Dyella sp. TaxID=1869338 RepID=UPI002BB0F20F|nr:ribonuclease domain-containing protein [Dyella sp.]HTV84268.1 ribonuclease domain-containing protein [Dyella sp.]
MSTSRLTSLLLLVILIGGILFWNRHSAPTATMVSQGDMPLPVASKLNCPAAKTNLPAFMPPEACFALVRILQGGPFPYSQDGVVFGNREGLLPGQPRGYYHEYTVDTPGASDRGTRRIITGGTPAEVFYYTGDHYRSFQLFQVNR